MTRPLDTEEVERPDDLLDYVKELAPAPKRLALYALSLEAQVEAYREHPLGCEQCMAGVRRAVEMGWRYLDNTVLCEESQKALARHNEIEGNEPCDHPDCERTKHDDGFHQFSR